MNLIPESVTEIRVVDIVGLDKQADGGTHVRVDGRGRPRRGGQDRVQGQGQQAHPPARRGRLKSAGAQARGSGRPTALVMRRSTSYFKLSDASCASSSGKACIAYRPSRRRSSPAHCPWPYSIVTLGTMRASQAGNHQFAFPKICVKLGTSTPSERSWSRPRPRHAAEAEHLHLGDRVGDEAPERDDRDHTADMITRAVCEMPVATRGASRRSCRAPRARVSRNTS